MESLRENLSRALRGEDIEQFSFAVYTWLYDLAQFQEDEDVSNVARLSAASPYRVEYEKVTEEITPLPDGGDLTTYHTPLGDLQRRRALEPGYGSLWAMEHFVKRPEDWPIVQYLLEDGHYVEDQAGYDQADLDMAEAGLVMASVDRMPFQRLWIEFADLEQLCFLLADDRDRADRLVSLMTRKALEGWKIVARSDAEFVWAPDNLTADILSPELYRRYAQPYYEALAEVLHPAHKRIVAHMDGHLLTLAELIAETPVDVIESFTPPPNGNLRLDEAWSAWANKCIWVNFPPSLHFLEPEEIQERILELVAQAGQRRRLAFEISEDVPRDLVAPNILAIAEALREA
jgi:hypothetical protein